MINLAALVLCALTLPHAPGRYLAFPVASEFVMFDARGNEVRRFTELHGLKPLQLSVSSDGGMLVFAAREREGTQPRLFLARADGVESLLRDAPIGHYAAPRFSLDGRSVVYVYRPDGPMGTGPGASNAQIYRVDLRSRNVTQLTSSQGCKGAPIEVRASEVVFNHSTCTGYQSIGVWLTGREATKIGGRQTSLWQPRPSPDARRLAYLERERGRTVLKVKFGSTAGRELQAWDGELEGVSLEWSSDSAWVYFVSNDEIVGRKMGVE